PPWGGGQGGTCAAINLKRQGRLCPLRALARLGFLQIQVQNRHFEIVAALAALFIDEQHANELLAEQNVGGIFLLWARDDAQRGAAQLAPDVTFHFANVLDVRGDNRHLEIVADLAILVIDAQYTNRLLAEQNVG